MINSVRRAIPIALAVILALVGGALAGDNAGATFTLASASSVGGVGDGDAVTLEVAVSDFVNVKQLKVLVEADAAAFNLGGTSMALGSEFSAADGWMVMGALVDASNPNQVELAAALLDLTRSKPGVNGETSFTISVPASDGLAIDAETTISVVQVTAGPTSTDNDVLSDVGVAVVVNPPVTEPVLTAVGDSDVSADFSAVGAGGGDGEVALTVDFADASGAAASGQSITWSVTNNGAEAITVDGSSVAAGASADVSSSTDADGEASITLDSEGDKSSGSTSASITASTSAENSDGEAVGLAVEFSVTWDVPVPAELAAFAGSVTPEQGVLLQWATTSQTNNLGWEVFRSVDNTAFQRVSSLISGEGTTDVLRTYEYLDENPPVADAVFYYLRQIDLDGSASRSNVIEVAFALTAFDQPALPTVNALMQNYPNPFNPETSLRFELAQEANVSLRIYGAAGQVVRTLISGTRAVGSYTELWDGRNDAGIKVGSGVYFYELRTDGFSSMKKMTLVQ
ncbi:MAG: FlgD immunoglobulin-like domain containing protein [Candidatus Latescibacterota bacterium]|nr:FlgD immunoglobulin-like domain containing protein [Candidatus Latescibacterota bacterium]